MSTTPTKRKQAKPKTADDMFEEVCAREIAAHDRYVMEQAKEMSRPKATPKKSPK